MSYHMPFRALRADEVDVRVGNVSKAGTGFSLLLYKDARCDMQILDECVGELNWKREHSRDNHNCTVSIWNPATTQWVGKEDTGSESNQDAQKGLASDSFKRACFNWGIGRELYTAPFIWITGQDPKRFKGYVAEMDVVGGQVTKLVINDSSHHQIFKFQARNLNKTKAAETPPPAATAAPYEAHIMENEVESARFIAASIDNIEDLRSTYAALKKNGASAESLAVLAERGKHLS